MVYFQEQHIIQLAPWTSYGLVGIAYDWPLHLPFAVCEEEVASLGVHHLEVTCGSLCTCTDKVIVCNDIGRSYWRPSGHQ